MSPRRQRKTGTGAKRGLYLRRALCDSQGLSPVLPATRSSRRSVDVFPPQDRPQFSGHSAVANRQSETRQPPSAPRSPRFGRTIHRFRRLHRYRSALRRPPLGTANWSLRTRGEAVAVSREVHLGVSPVVCRLVSRAASLPTSAPESRPESRPRPCVLSGAEPRAVSEVAPRAVPQAEPVVAPFVIGLEESIVVCFGISSAPSQAPAPGAAPGPPTPRENCGPRPRPHNTLWSRES